jgi:hypothetical protein
MEPEPAAQPHPDGNSDENTQQCDRCGGLLLLTYYQDLHDDTGQIDIWALRCSVCGEVIDPVILKNRQAPAPNLLYGTKERKYSQRIVPIDSPRDRASDVSDHEDESGPD